MRVCDVCASAYFRHIKQIKLRCKKKIKPALTRHIADSNPFDFALSHPSLIFSDCLSFPVRQWWCWERGGKEVSKTDGVESKIVKRALNVKKTKKQTENNRIYVSVIYRISVYTIQSGGPQSRCFFLSSSSPDREKTIHTPRANLELSIKHVFVVREEGWRTWTEPTKSQGEHASSTQTDRQTDHLTCDHCKATVLIPAPPRIGLIAEKKEQVLKQL